MEWQHYNVHFKSADLDGKAMITALSKEDAKKTFEQMAAKDVGAPGSRADIPFEAIVTKVIGPLGRLASPKQKLAQSYGFIAGSLKGAELQFRKSLAHMQSSDPKITASRGLVNSQFAKLQRDLRDCFKRAGLNVK